jgi:hypothetical protein
MIYTLDEFNELYNEHQKKRKVYVKKKFKLEKTKTVLKRLTETVNENGIPSVKVVRPAVTKKVPDTNAFQNLIIAYLELIHGISARRISSEGRWRQDAKGGRFIKGMNNGLEDIQAIGKGGKIIAIEVKFTKTDRMRPDQIKRMHEVIDSGGIYIVAPSFEQFQEELLKQIYNGN